MSGRRPRRPSRGRSHGTRRRRPRTETDRQRADRRLRRASARPQAGRIVARRPMSPCRPVPIPARLSGPAPASYCVSARPALRGAEPNERQSADAGAQGEGEREPSRSPTRTARRHAGTAGARQRERARRSSAASTSCAACVDPFDVMRSTRALAPHDPRLNDVRWLIGEALRRLHQRAELDALRAVRSTASAPALTARAPAFPRAKRRCMRATSCARPRNAPAPPPGRCWRASSSRAAACANAGVSCRKSPRPGAPTRSSPTASGSRWIASAISSA